MKSPIPGIIMLCLLAWLFTPAKADEWEPQVHPSTPMFRSDTITVTPLIPGTRAIDPRQPRTIYQPQGHGTVDVYQTIPGTPMRDPYAPSYRIERD